MKGPLSWHGGSVIRVVLMRWNISFRGTCRAFLPVAMLGLALSLCNGQMVRATLSGSVTDQSGGLIPDAHVTVKNVETGVEATASSDVVGGYIFPALNPGRYTITFEKVGFKLTQVVDITLLVNQQAHLDVQLQVGAELSRVTVVGAPAQVETTNANIGTVIEENQVDDLPLNLRRFGALAILVPGSVNDTGGQATLYANYYGPMSEQNYGSNGGRDSSNITLIDGVDARNYGGGGSSVQPPPDAVQEFKIQTNTYSAAFGVAAGATINLVTKSGTNEIHGTVYEFLRNDKLDSRNYFALPGSAVPEYRRNQFGFAVGGPILKNKLFWFVNYEELREIQGLSLTNIVPTDVQKGGDFSSQLTGQTINLCGAGGPSNLNFDSGQLFNPATESIATCPAGSANAGSAVLVGNPIPGNKITSIDPVAQKLLSEYPEPNRPGLVNFVNEQPQDRTDKQFLVRIDDTISPKDQLFGRYLFGQTNLTTPTNGYASIPGFGTVVYFRAQNFALGWTHTFGPHLLNEARFGFQRQYLLNSCQGCPFPAGTIAALGINNLTAISPLYEEVPTFSLANFATLGDVGYTPDIFPDMDEKYNNNLTWIHGRHTVVVGTDMQFLQTFRNTAPVSVQGGFSYNGQYSSLAGAIPNASGVADLADFLLGYPANGQRNLHYLNTNQAGIGMWSFYGQDDIKVSSRLSMTIGLRWEYRRNGVDKNNNIVTFVPTGPKFSGPGNGLLVTAAPDVQNDSFCTDPAYSYLTSNGKCLVASSAQRAQLGFTGRTQRTLVFPYYGNWDPRLGLAWRPFNSDKFVVRTGAGLFTDFPMTNILTLVNNNPVFSPTQVYNTAFGSPPPLTNGIPTTIENVFGPAAIIPPLTQQLAYLYLAPHYRAPEVAEWSFGIGSQLARDWALEVDYVGNAGYHLEGIHYFGNQPLPGLGALQPRRPYPDFNVMISFSSDANANYNSLQAKLTKRLSHGLSLLTSYSWSHGLDNNEGDEGPFAQQDDNNLHANWANSYLDIRQRLVVSYTWDLPFGKGHAYLNRSGAINAVLGGWKFSGIFSVQSGPPFTVVSTQDFSNTGSTSPRPDRICNGTGPKTVNAWFNTSCFTTTALEEALANGTPRFGNSGRNILAGPGYVNWDMNLHKDFQLSERFKLEFRSEFYNALNTPHFGSPVSQVGNPAIGQLVSAGAPREIQFGAKLSF